MTKESSSADGEGPPLPTSPAGLLQPSGIAAVQDKLIARGYLEQDARSQSLDRKTETALRSFQRDQGLPATGAPDDATVQKLGLKPNDIFRSSPAGDGKP